MAERTPPHNLEAEKSAIGSVFIKPAILVEMAGVVAVDDFFLPAHREIWEAMLALDKRKRAVDPISVGDELKVAGVLGKLPGGPVYLSEVMNETPTAENALHYARIVREKASLRALIAACAEVQSTAHGDFGVADEFLRESVAKVSRVALRDGERSTESLHETIDKMYRDLEQAQLGKLVMRIPTRIAKLDRVLNGGLSPEHLIVPVGLTSMGKSSLGFQICFRGAEEGQVPCLIFTLEMSRRETAIKGAASLQKVNTNVFNAPAPGEKADWQTITVAGNRLARLTDLVTIEEHRSIGQIVAVAHAWRVKNPGPAVILVDHIQKVQGVRQKNGNRQEEVWGVAQALKNLAKDLRLPVIAPGQLDNDAAKEKRAPRLGDIRDSKAIEHEADVVISIHRDRSLVAGKVEIGVLKHRGGRVGKVVVDWMGPWQGFENPAPGDHNDEDDDSDD